MVVQVSLASFLFFVRKKVSACIQAKFSNLVKQVFFSSQGGARLWSDLVVEKKKKLDMKICINFQIHSPRQIFMARSDVFVGKTIKCSFCKKK